MIWKKSEALCYVTCSKPFMYDVTRKGGDRGGTPLENHSRMASEFKQQGEVKTCLVTRFSICLCADAVPNTVKFRETEGKKSFLKYLDLYLEACFVVCLVLSLFYWILHSVECRQCDMWDVVELHLIIFIFTLSFSVYLLVYKMSKIVKSSV